MFLRRFQRLAVVAGFFALAPAAPAQVAGYSGTPLVHTYPAKREKDDASLHYVAAFGDGTALPGLDSAFAASVLDGGAAEIVNVPEIVNGCASSSRGAASDFRSLIFAPLRAKQRTLGIIVLSNESGEPYTAADLKLLNTIALQTAAAIENSLLCADMVHAARYREQLAAIQKELDTARAIQHSLVPRVFPPFPERTEFEIHAQMISARAVGGDFFDFFLIDDEHLGLVIGDVSGKGTPAALYMAMAHAHVRTTALRSLAPEECMAEVNRILVKEKVSTMFATCFYGILNTRTGELRYSSAGHNPPYLIGSCGVVQALDVVGGTPLGMLPLGRYDSGSTQLKPGDALFLYTDGVPEAKTFEDEELTDARLIQLLSEAGTLTPQAIITTVNTRISDFTAGAPQSDDITIVAVRLTRLSLCSGG